VRLLTRAAWTLLILATCAVIPLGGCDRESVEFRIWDMTTAATSEVEIVDRVLGLVEKAKWMAAGPGIANPRALRVIVGSGGGARTYWVTGEGLVRDDGRVAGDTSLARRLFAIAVSDGLLVGRLSALATQAQIREATLVACATTFRVAEATPALVAALGAMRPTAGGASPSPVIGGTPEAPRPVCTLSFSDGEAGKGAATDTSVVRVEVYADNTGTLRCGPFSAALVPSGPVLDAVLALPEVGAESSLAVADEVPYYPRDPEVNRNLLFGLIRYLDSNPLETIDFPGRIAPITLSWTLGGSAWLECRVGPGSVVVLDGQLREAPFAASPDFGETVVALFLAPDRIAGALLSESVLRVEAKDFSVTGEADSAARSRLREALARARTERVGDMYPGPWYPMAPWYELRFHLGGYSAVLTLTEPDKAILSWNGSLAVGLASTGALREWLASVCPVARPDSSDVASLFWFDGGATLVGSRSEQDRFTPDRDKIIRCLLQGRVTGNAGGSPEAAVLTFQRTDGTEFAISVGEDWFSYAGATYWRPNLLSDLTAIFDGP